MCSDKYGTPFSSPEFFGYFCLEVEWAWAWAWRPRPNFWLALNMPWPWGSTSLNFRKAWSRLKLGFYNFISKKLGLETSSRDILTSSGLSGLKTPSSCLKNLGSFHLLKNSADHLELFLNGAATFCLSRAAKMTLADEVVRVTNKKGATKMWVAVLTRWLKAVAPWISFSDNKNLT